MWQVSYGNERSAELRVSRTSQRIVGWTRAGKFSPNSLSPIMRTLLTAPHRLLRIYVCLIYAGDICHLLQLVTYAPSPLDTCWLC
jgi:hypothetical protein